MCVDIRTKKFNCFKSCSKIHVYHYMYKPLITEIISRKQQEQIKENQWVAMLKKHYKVWVELNKLT